jgi:hypothetical protein
MDDGDYQETGRDVLKRLDSTSNQQPGTSNRYSAFHTPNWAFSGWSAGSIPQVEKETKPFLNPFREDFAG